jgi:hypothetical protein
MAVCRGAGKVPAERLVIRGVASGRETKSRGALPHCSAVLVTVQQYLHLSMEECKILVRDDLEQDLGLKLLIDIDY